MLESLKEMYKMVPLKFGWTCTNHSIIKCHVIFCINLFENETKF